MLYFPYKFANSGGLSWSRDEDWPVASLVAGLNNLAAEVIGASNIVASVLTPTIDVVLANQARFFVSAMTPTVAVNAGHRADVSLPAPSAVAIASVATGVRIRASLSTPGVNIHGGSSVSAALAPGTMDAVVSVGTIAGSASIGAPSFSMDIVASAQVDGQATVALSPPGVKAKVRNVSRYGASIVEHEESQVDLWARGTIGAPSLGVLAELS